MVGRLHWNWFFVFFTSLFFISRLVWFGFCLCSYVDPVQMIPCGQFFHRSTTHKTKIKSGVQKKSFNQFTVHRVQVDRKSQNCLESSRLWWKKAHSPPNMVRPNILCISLPSSSSTTQCRSQRTCVINENRVKWEVFDSSNFQFQFRTRGWCGAYTSKWPNTIAQNPPYIAISMCLYRTGFVTYQLINGSRTAFFCYNHALWIFSDFSAAGCFGWQQQQKKLT